ncbi:MAG: hypothetical protein FJW38_00200 [Acidobacteria bacterium]|nr:hypothetical protein [Acidobacteriota bacterium]
MQEQNSNNHTQRDPYFLALAAIFGVTVGYSIKHALDYPNGMTIWLVVLSMSLLVMVFRMRVYSLRVQDRVIRLEERLRMKELISTDLDTSQLDIKQIIALRFASDAEYPALVKMTLDEKLTPKQIKALIKNWRADFHRV